MEDRYFAASNSGRGFKSYFRDIFKIEKLDHIYIIKGGPGTGKNVFMRRIADLAESKKRKVIYYYCSSDQTSLDGIIIDGRIAFIDGTAPHSAEPSLPGCAEDIIDLGAFWSIEALSKERDDIVKLNIEKKRHYERAYRYLAAYQEISEAILKTIEPFVDMKKLRKNINSLLLPLDDGEEFTCHTAICDSIGMEGRVRFDSLENKAGKIYTLSDIFDSAHIYFAELANAAMARSLAVTVSYDPINSDRIDAIYFERDSILFTLKESSGAKNISMSRFLSMGELSGHKASLKNAMKLRALMLEETLLALGDVKKAHFELERIYRNAMDFEKKERFTEEFVAKLIL